ncbi:phycobiliprotein lyase [Cyanobium sp. Morenito 9A2]|uniref:phycobiliprotein lyase n=1 Tax=Cyanobium sp. Morenito 9A2 TaxID=2823718 RepID=UPI0028F440C8|nr:phycobiliprotein lyase [Cyanobium sp. Morenito 9A2]
MTDSSAPFPPEDLAGFLAFCAGEWMSLRSRFALAAAGDDDWHSSERGELQVAWQAGDGQSSIGVLVVTPKGQAGRQLRFEPGGRFHATDDGTTADLSGSWQLWPDGSLELTLLQGERELRERIWFTKPNLRLRSTVERYADGRPSDASFSSEIRRVSRPPAQEA